MAITNSVRSTGTPRVTGSVSQPAGRQNSGSSSTSPAVSSYLLNNRKVDLGASTGISGLARFSPRIHLTPTQNAVDVALSAGARGSVPRGAAVVQLTEALKALA